MTMHDEHPEDRERRPDDEPEGTGDAQEDPVGQGPEEPRGEEPPTQEQPGGPQASADEAPTQPLGAGAGGGDGPRRLLRSRSDRVFGGVASGVAKYFNIDPVIVRVVFVALTFIGGAGLLLYLAALLLVPDEQGHVAADASSFRGKVLIGVAGVLLFVALVAAVPWGWGDWFLPGFLFPVAFFALLGLGLWWLVQGGTGGGDPSSAIRTIVFACLLLVGCWVLALGSGWAAAVGGGAVIAGLVIAAGVLLVVGAFVARVRWLILPALAIALPLAVVSAAGIDVDDSVGDRNYRPTSIADVRDRYELGMGELTVDLRDVDLPAGDTPLDLEVGVGHLQLLVPDGVCVASRADVGAGTVGVFDKDSSGVDVEWDDRREGRPDTPTIVVDAEVGLGAFEVDHEAVGDNDGFGDHDGDDSSNRGFETCEGSRA